MRAASLTLATLLFLLALPLRAQERPPSTLTAPPEIWLMLNELADTATVEYAMCLTGVVRNDTAYVDAIRAARVMAQTDTSIMRGPCPMGSLLVWHNHVWRERQYPPPCHLSGVDFVTSLAERAWYVMVQVDADHACWWSRAQLLSAAYKEFLWAVPGQTRSRRQ